MCLNCAMMASKVTPAVEEEGAEVEGVKEEGATRSIKT